MEAQALAAEGFYHRDNNPVGEQELSKYVADASARRWVQKKLADVRRQGEVRGQLYEQANREVMAQYERQADSALRRIQGYSAAELKDNEISVKDLIPKLNLPPVEAPKPREGQIAACLKYWGAFFIKNVLATTDCADDTQFTDKKSFLNHIEKREK